MTVYIYYLSLPDNLKQHFPEEMVDSFREIEGSLKMLSKIYFENTQMWHYLYAYTDNVEYAKTFESVHDMSLFTRHKKKLDKSEFKKLAENNILAKLDYYDVTVTKETVKMLCTKCELYDINDTFELMMDVIMSEYSRNEYLQFKDNYIEALDLLLYCTNNRLNGEDNEFYAYNYSFGVTAEGYCRNVFPKPRVIQMYARYYKLLLRKD